MKKLILLTGVAALLAAGCSSSKKSANKQAGPVLTNNNDSMSYSLGILVGNNLKQQNFDSLNIQAFANAMELVFSNNNSDSVALIKQQDANMVVNSYMMQKMAREAEKQIQFLVENKKKPGVVTTASGLQYKVVKEGTGKKPTAQDQVTVHYTGSLVNGTQFETSVGGEPISFALGGVIAGWTEGLQLMSEGSTYIFYIPSNLGYGERGSPPKIGPNATLIFEVQLLQVHNQ
ncbi:MAG TPA: FKBP-type peptidyl-prolyl cis-trans isomerase [Bacteroidia bacterium]|nr:FKBP-type peptidyl-prolyl cis-trans isomerase [Bacteroidia bacterium]